MIMGTSQWNRRVPYQPVMDAASRQARQEAYAEGDYYRREADPQTREPNEEEYVAWEWCGTGRPDAAAAERALDDGLDGFERRHGAYVNAYEGDRPAWIYFFGWSGD
jgi:hypothetical protein